MKIVIAGQTYGPRNGPGVFMQRLAEGLVERGQEVVVAVPAPRLRSTHRVERGVEIEEIRAASLAALWPGVSVTVATRAAAREILDRHSPDLVHIHDHYPLSRALARTARRRGIPVIATNHFLPQNLSSQMWVCRNAAVRHAFERLVWRDLLRLLDSAAMVTTPTETAAAVLRDHGLRAPLRAISCGVDLDRFTPASASERESLRRGRGVPSRPAVFVYAGRLDADKRIETLIDALAMLDGDVMLVIIGHGAIEQRLRARAAPLGGRVVFAGFVSDGELREWLRCADFFAMPGDAELQSIATLEAMACGLPVLACDALALREIVMPGVNGERFRPLDAADAASRMRSLAHARDRWSSMSQASRVLACRHAIRTTIDAYHELYRNALTVHATGAVPAHVPWRA